MKQTKKHLSFFLIITALLITIGLIFIYSSSSVYALEKFGSAHYYVKKQAIGLIIGLLCMIIAMLMPYKLIKKLTPYFFLGSLIITACTIIPGIQTVINGSRRWLNIGGFLFQPSELLKISFVLYCAYFLEKKQYNLSSFKNGFVPFVMVIGITAIILLKQPDFGQTVTLTTTALLMYFITQGITRHLLLSVAAIIPVGIALILLKPYRFKRILTFLNPWNDPQGSGFQIIQSLIAIGSGNFFGAGLAQSKQKFFYLPMQHTDFIFSIIAEETGFFGSTILISLYIAFLYYGLKIASQLTNTFRALSVAGFTLLISLQTLINIFVATGLAPTKGIGLPFISYGNSSLICLLCMIGICTNFVYEERMPL